MSARRAAVAAGTAFGSLLLVALLHGAGVLRPLQDAAYDRAVLWTAAPRAEDLPLALVAIDEPSLREQGPWPWPRSRIAELLRRLADAEPRVVAIDLMLAGLPQEGGGSAADLREAVGRFHRVVLPVAASWGRSGDDAWRDLLSWPAEMSPDGALLGHTLLPGVAERGRGGMCRGLERVLRLPAVRPGGAPRDYPPLALQAVAALGGALPAADESESFVRIRFADPGHPGYPRISASALLAAGGDPAPSLRGRLVFVGGTAAGLPDFRATPVGDLAGVEIQAQAAATVLRREEILLLPAAVGLLVAAVIGGVAALLVAHGRLALGGCVAACGAALVTLAALGLLRAADRWLDPAAPAAALAACTTATLALRSRLAGAALVRRERQISALSRAAAALGGDAERLPDLFQGAVDLVRALPGVDGVSALLADPGSGRVLARGRAGAAGEVERLWRDADLEAALRGTRHRSFGRADILAHPWLRLATDEATRGAVVVRLGAPGHEAGVLVATTRRSASFSPQETDVIAALAAQAALSARSLEAARRSRDLLEGMLASLVEAIEARDPYLRGHAARVSRLAERLAAELGLPAAERETVRLAGLLHDVGKVALPDPVLRHPGSFGPAEWREMQAHPEIGRRILAPVAEALTESRETVEGLLPAILHHHRRFDGAAGSYPAASARQPIPLAARILAVADAYDGIVSERPHRPAARPAEAIAEIRRGSGGQFDPEVVRALVGLHRRGDLE